MRKHCSDVCKLRPCLDKESKNSAHTRTIMTTALQQQYSQAELTFWIALVHKINILTTVHYLIHSQCITHISHLYHTLI